MDPMVAALRKDLNHQEAEAAWNALAQFIENTREAFDEGCFEDPSPDMDMLLAAERVMGRLDAAKAALAMS